MKSKWVGTGSTTTFLLLLLFSFFLCHILYPSLPYNFKQFLKIPLAQHFPCDSKECDLSCQAIPLINTCMYFLYMCTYTLISNILSQMGLLVFTPFNVLSHSVFMFVCFVSVCGNSILNSWSAWHFSHSRSNPWQFWCQITDGMHQS